jgi:hypothetical protein
MRRNIVPPRSGVPMAQAMAYVGHASTLIHKIYQRLQPADLTLSGDGRRVPDRDGVDIGHL